MATQSKLVGKLGGAEAVTQAPPPSNEYGEPAYSIPVVITERSMIAAAFSPSSDQDRVYIHSTPKLSGSTVVWHNSGVFEPGKWYLSAYPVGQKSAIHHVTIPV